MKKTKQYSPVPKHQSMKNNLGKFQDKGHERKVINTFKEVKAGVNRQLRELREVRNELVDIQEDTTN